MMLLRTPTWLILFTILLALGPPPAGGLSLASSARFGTATVEPKVSGPQRFVDSTRQRRRSLTHNWVANTHAEGNQPSKNLFDYILEEDVESLRRYVQRGGKVHVADALGETAMLVATGTGNAEVVEILASAGDADVNYPCFHGGETPLMVACTQGYLAVADYLVNKAGANVNVMNHRGDTALSLAAFWGKVDCLKFLLSLPDINTEIENIQGKRAGEGMRELMRDESKDAETLALLKISRTNQGLTR